MPLWELLPIDSADPSWEASTYCGKVIVRAAGEAAARAQAEMAFGVKTRFNPGAGLKPPPWKRPQLASARVIRDRRYESEGPPEVLYPPLA